MNKKTVNTRYEDLMAGFTVKQRAFVEAYAGNGTEACRIAGYEGSDNVLGVAAYDLLKNPKILEAIELRLKPESNKRIASREELQEFWTSTINAEDVDPNVKLRASELLGRSHAMFVEKHQVESVFSGYAERLQAALERKQLESADIIVESLPTD